MKPRIVVTAAAFSTLAAASPAAAHAADGAGSFVGGLTHALGGLDHLLAMLVVGAASVRLRRWWLPAVFVALVAAGSAVGMNGVAIANIEVLVVVSAVLLAASLWRDRTTVALVAGAAFVHGLAHGSEAPTAGGGRYLAGFLVAAALLHSIGALMMWVRAAAPVRRRSVPTAA